MQLCDSEDLVLCLDDAHEGFEIKQLLVGRVVGGGDGRFRTLYLTTELFLHLPLEFPLRIRRRHEGETLIAFKALRITPHRGRRIMDVVGQERIPSDGVGALVGDSLPFQHSGENHVRFDSTP